MTIYIRRYMRTTRSGVFRFSGNLGDDMNPLLVKYITGSKCKEVINKNVSHHSPIYLVIGTILHWANHNSIVWGSGFGSTDAEVKSKPIDICAVRGPLTHKRLAEIGISAPEVFGDPALLYSRYYTPPKNIKYDIGFIPHYTDASNPLVNKIVKQSKNIRLIDVTKPAHKVIDQINQCNTILSSSLHGIITAHTYGIRAMHISFENSPLNVWFKFFDYYLSIKNNSYNGPVIINDSTTISELEKKALQEPKLIDFDTDKLLSACPFLPEK